MELTEKIQTSTSFGEVAKLVRRTFEYGMRDLCKKMDTCPSEWSCIEQGIKQVSPEQVDKFISVIGGESDFSESLIASLIKDWSKVPVVEKQFNTEKEVLEILPFLVCTQDGHKPTKEELENLIECLKRNW